MAALERLIRAGSFFERIGTYAGSYGATSRRCVSQRRYSAEERSHPETHSFEG